MKGSNSTLKDRGFIKVDGKMVWQEVHHHKLEETGCVYITISPDDVTAGREHMVYKLSKIPFDKGEEEPAKPYFWSALWNTCTHSGHRVPRRYWISKYATIEEAVQAKLDQNWPVRMVPFDELFPFGIKFK